MVKSMAVRWLWTTQDLRAREASEGGEAEEEASEGVEVAEEALAAVEVAEEALVAAVVSEGEEEEETEEVGTQTCSKM